METKCIVEKMAGDLIEDLRKAATGVCIIVIVLCIGAIIATPIALIAHLILGYNDNVSLLIGVVGVFVTSIGWILYESLSGRYKAAVEACK
jgi:hypothetical protein